MELIDYRYAIKTCFYNITSKLGSCKNVLKRISRPFQVYYYNNQELLYLFFNLLAITFVCHLINWINLNLLTPDLSNIFYYLIYFFLTVNLYCLFIIFLSSLYGDTIFLNNANHKKFFKRRSARDTIKRKLANFLKENVSLNRSLIYIIPFEKTTLKRLLQLSLNLKTFIFIILEILFSNRVYHSINLVLVLGLIGPIPLLTRLYMMITNGMVNGFDIGTEYMGRTDNMWSPDKNEMFSIKPSTQSLIKKNTFGNFPQGDPNQGSSQNGLGGLTDDDRRKEDKDFKGNRPADYKYGTILTNGEVEITVPIIKQVKPEALIWLDEYIKKKDIKDEEYYENIAALNLEIDVSISTISSKSGFDYNKDKIILTIKNADERMKILNNCKSEVNLENRKSTLNKIENLKIYTKVVDSKGHHEIVNEIKKSPYIATGKSMNFQRMSGIKLSSWMISGKTQIIPFDSTETTKNSYLNVFLDGQKIPKALKEDYKYFTDPFLDFQDNLKLKNTSPFALATGAGEEKRLIELDPNKPHAFFFTSIYEEDKGHNMYAANILKPEELEDKIKDLDKYFRETHPVLFQAKPAECELILANTFLSMRVLNSTVLNALLEDSKEFRQGKKASFWTDMALRKNDQGSRERCVVLENILKKEKLELAAKQGVIIKK